MADIATPTNPEISTSNKRKRSHKKSRTHKKQKTEDIIDTTTTTTTPSDNISDTPVVPSNVTSADIKNDKVNSPSDNNVIVSATKPNSGNNQLYITNDIESLEEFRSTHNITVTGDTTNFSVFRTFKETGFPDSLLKATQNFVSPTGIQSQCWPILLSKRDVVGIAKTGSGKTIAFGFPGLNTLINSPSINKKVPRILILAPTRELAIQTEEILKPIGKEIGIIVESFYGGIPRGPHIRVLKSGVDVIVATPGRLLDLVNDNHCDLSNVKYLVLDEADRMLDLGFEKDIRAIIERIPVKTERQTAMFSATWPVAIQKFAYEFLSNPIKVTVGTMSEGMSSNESVKQIVEVIEDEDRKNRIKELLRDYHKTRTNRVLIFVLYKKEASFLENYLTRAGWNCTSIHADKNQKQRCDALNSFKSGQIPLLVATDVAARGLDIPKVEYVINYSFPLTVEDYVHRIGRTGRAGATGIAHTFFQQCDKLRAGELALFLRESSQEIPESLGKWGLAIKKKEPKLGKIDMTQKTGHITFDSDDE